MIEQHVCSMSSTSCTSCHRFSINTYRSTSVNAHISLVRFVRSTVQISRWFGQNKQLEVLNNDHSCESKNLTFKDWLKGVTAGIVGQQDKNGLANSKIVRIQIEGLQSRVNSSILFFLPSLFVHFLLFFACFLSFP
ncbi:hypothetical protein KP509_36G003300 [Ceratopteris richardii]|uniref:Uncharacterized protein n=1 Tax=Ceratopteris richardii TaxID=49495 RepID=A0A8T2Q9V7_CERRI|nr:hypothetical protein KP509_36G003300 [Ceratopteris richardii]